MPNECCVNLKLGVLFIAALGVFFNLIGAIYFLELSRIPLCFFRPLSGVFTGISLYFGFRSIACVLGFIGVLRDNFLFVKIFSHYYLIAVAIDFVTISFFIVIPFFLATCTATCSSLRILFVVLMVFVDIVQIYFGVAIWSYYQKIRAGYRLISINEGSPPSGDNRLSNDEV